MPDHASGQVQVDGGPEKTICRHWPDSLDQLYFSIRLVDVHFLWNRFGIVWQGGSPWASPHNIGSVGHPIAGDTIVVENISIWTPGVVMALPDIYETTKIQKGATLLFLTVNRDFTVNFPALLLSHPHAKRISLFPWGEHYHAWARAIPQTGFVGNHAWFAGSPPECS